MSFEVSAALLLTLLSAKELIGASRSKRTRRAALFLYALIIPLVVVFVVTALARVAALPPY